ncbi:MAG: hypothetical protein M1818_006548 [Claussenomyces sp. TS43310]|nr:MAG: hypothetical protein M1818_006548 [Claussenomyces sp. TS43310]
MGPASSTRSKTSSTAPRRMGSVSEKSRSKQQYYWNVLPTELRIWILKLLAEPISEEDDACQPYTKSTYAVVCKEWRDYFEQINFRHLIIHQYDVSVLTEILQGRRRKLVKWIWLRLELPWYSCSVCRTKEIPKEIRSHISLFTKALVGLLTTLSSWRDEEVCSEGITLELSAHSPSDRHHFFRELRDRHKDTAWSKEVKDIDVEHNGHGWTQGFRIEDPDSDAISRVFGSGSLGLRLDFRAAPVRNLSPQSRNSTKPSTTQSRSWKPRYDSHKKSTQTTAPRRKLPEVSVIKAFVLRRQFYRIFSMSIAITPIVESLTQLREFIYEPLRHADEKHDDQNFFRRLSEQHNLFANVFSTRKETLKRICIFDGCYRDREDWVFNEIEAHHTNELVSAAFHRAQEARVEARKRLSASLALVSKNFEELHASPTVDAKYFFFQFPPGDEHPYEDNLVPKFDEWTRLRYLSLTAYPQNQQDCSHLLHSAAIAAWRMPQLQVMELWNAKLVECWDSNSGSAFIFRYERKSETGLPKIVLQTSWNYSLEETTIQAWIKVARGHIKYFRELECECLSISPDKENFKKWQIVKLLALKGRMLNQTTLQQMEWEAERY